MDHDLIPLVELWDCSLGADYVRTDNRESVGEASPVGRSQQDQSCRWRSDDACGIPFPESPRPEDLIPYRWADNELLAGVCPN